MLHEASQDTSGGHEEEHDARLNQLKQIVRLCYLLLQEVRDTVERYLPQVSDGEKEGVSSAGSTILHRLRQTADAAQQQIREQEQNSTSKRSYNRQVSNATFCSNYASDTFDHREGTPLADIPPRLKQLMDQLEEEQISLYIVEHKEEMTPTVLNAARQYYAGRKKMKASLLYLEAQLQTAIAIPNRALVAVYFQKAKALCYGDDAASGDQSWLQAFFENSEVFSAAKDLMDHPDNSTYSLEEGSVILNSSNSSATSESDSSSSSYDSDLNILSRESSPTANDTAVEKVNDFLETHLSPTTLNSRSIHTLREQLKEILVSPQRTIHFNESGGEILSFSLSIENDKLFRFVHLWCEVLTTNLKPMGVFRKVPLNLYHLCKIMGDMVSADDTLLCPIAGRVAALVERANFFGFPDDSPPVSTLDIIIVTHCLIGGRFLSMFLGETFKLQKSGHGRKVFLENSIYHYEEVILYIVRIAVFMEKYVEFPFKANTNEEKQSLMNFILQERVPEQSVPPAEPVLKQERPSVSVEKEKSVTTTTTTTTITPADRVSQIVKELASCFSYTSNCMANRDSDDGTPVPSNHTAAFDETSPYSKIKQSMREVILPNLVFVLDKGLRPAAGVYTLWEVLRALQGAWQPEGTELEDVGAVHSPSVVSFLSLVELVQALTDEQGRNGKFLRSLSPAAVSTLRLKMFLRECLNRHQLITMIELVFYGSGGLGKELFDIYAYYDPSSCVFSRENNVTEMIVLLKKISLFPFVLLQDSDMQGEAGTTALR
ncbi:hypothetical protein ADEAN_000694300 [Angomonas deanei]|uniref:RUN domain-containing protein n=1 Tax=Angomonas deanei TaxID=59799 RepID=A0A7G2CHW3_9TRYP|nr:hypothetical protein ADEAN_000694300 [Angomonas deanei]